MLGSATNRDSLLLKTLQYMSSSFDNSRKKRVSEFSNSQIPHRRKQKHVVQCGMTVFCRSKSVKNNYIIETVF